MPAKSDEVMQTESYSQLTPPIHSICVHACLQLPQQVRNLPLCCLLCFKARFQKMKELAGFLLKHIPDHFACLFNRTHILTRLYILDVCGLDQQNSKNVIYYKGMPSGNHSSSI